MPAEYALLHLFLVNLKLTWFDRKIFRKMPLGYNPA